MNLLSYEEFCDRVARIRKANHKPILRCYACGSTKTVVGNFHNIYEQYYVRKCVRCNSQKYLTSFTKQPTREEYMKNWE